jgi:cell division septation protein DedD
MAKHQDLCLQRGSRSEKSDQPAPDQPAEVAHRVEDSADSLPQANRIRFATETAPPARPASVGKPAATKIASASPAASGGGYAVQVSSQRNENELQSSFRALQAKYPKLLGGHEPMVRRADLGAKGVYYRAMVGPFVSAEQANELCANLKAAGGNCIVQKN